MDGLHGVMLGMGCLALLLGLLSLQRRRRIAGQLRPAALPEPDESAASPPVSVLAPCRGLDADFEAYVRAWLAQDYPRYEVRFVVESTADPAWGALRRLLAAAPGGRASLLVAGPATRCSQKLHNLLVGLAQVAPETAGLAFVDADARLHPQWLRALVAPLAELYRAYERVQAIYVERSHRRRGRGRLGAALWRAFYLGRLAIYNDIQYANYTRGARWPMACTAGETAAVIDANGDVRICELRQPIGNLRDYHGDFGRLWSSRARRAEVAQMRRDACDCTHICFIDDSATYDAKVALLPPLTYARRRRGRAAWSGPEAAADGMEERAHGR
jgi:hypothetical protein